MRELEQILIVGLVSGSVYGLAGTGLVITYKTSGIFNFAHGSVAAVAVFVFYWLHTTHGMAWPLAGALCLFVLAPIEGIALERLARVVDRHGTTMKVGATIGLLLMVLGIGTIWYGGQIFIFPDFLPTASFKLGGVAITWSDVIIFGVSVVGVGGLYYLFRHVRVGIAMRGIVDDPDLISLTGQNPVRIRRMSWIIGTSFASLAGLLIAPDLGVDATAITLLVVQAFGAAAVGYLSNLPLTYIGGLAIGVISAVVTLYTVNVPWLIGLPSGLPFIILIVVLIAMPRGKLVDRAARFGRIASSWRAPTRVRLATGAVCVAILALGPVLVGQDITIWSILLVDVILFLSLGLLVRTSGQVSLCHFTFAAIGAASFSHFVLDWHVPWLFAVLLAGVVTIPVGALVAIPAIRLPGVFLAVATLGFAILVEDVFFTAPEMFGSNQDGLTAPGPNVSVFGLQLSSNNGFYYVILLIALAVCVFVLAIERGRMGRFLAALADSPTALEVQGANIQVTRTVVFCISAAIAGVAGALTGSLYHYAAGSEFEWFGSVELAVIIIISVGGTPWYALGAAAAQALLPNYLPGTRDIIGYEDILFGFFIVLYVVQGGAPGVPLWLRQRLDRLGPPKKKPALRATATVQSRPHALREGSDNRRQQVDPGLDIRGLDVNFGGVRALAGVSLTAELGRVTGLIGPNGAGKTTLFNVCSGFLRPTKGAVSFKGHKLTGVSRSARARLGLGRTFQRTELFNSLSVRENVAIGREASMGGRNPISQLRMGAREDEQVEAAVEEALALVGLETLADRLAGTLTTGQRRLVEFARALAGPFDLIMLDEPSAGLDSEETVAFGKLLQRVVRERGTGILLVEHDVSLVRKVCDKIYVLDFGQLIYEGNAEEMAASGAVRSAYLGEEVEDAIPVQTEISTLDVAANPDKKVPHGAGTTIGSRAGVADVAANVAEPEGQTFSLVDISAGYGAISVLRDVTISVPPFSAVAVLGANGAGKTTLLRVATGLLRPSKGEVMLGSENLTRLPAHVVAQRGVCHIPESRGIFPSLNVRENIILASPKGQEASSLDRVRDKFPVLAARLNQTAGSLSGGEQQMLSIARAFLRNPKVVAVDEASLGLSPAAVERVYEALAEILAEGASLILVEQYVKRALNFADFVYVLTRGRVTYSGRAGDLDTAELLSTYLGNDSESATAGTRFDGAPRV